MNNPKSLSLRVKFLLLLTILPLAVLGAYLALAIDIFQNDKIAYVYEETTSISRTLALQTTASLNTVLANVRPLLQDWTSSNRFSSVSRAFMTAESPVHWIAVCEKSETGLEKIAFIGREGLVNGEAEADVILKTNFVIEKALTQKRTVLVPYKDERILLVENVESGPSGKAYVFFIFAEGRELFAAFRTPGSTSNYLVDDRGLVLMGPVEEERSYITQRLPLKFLQGDLKTQRGTEAVDDVKGQNLLIAYSRVDYGSYFVLSTVAREAALEAVTTLIRKSLIFFALLFCLTLVVSLVASKNLTGALTQLSQATQTVAQGHFEIRVPVTSSDEVGSLAQSFNRMAAEVSRLMSETAEKARMENELRTAQTVQETLFPPVSAKIGELQVFGHYEPASECGGDWWHYNWIDGKVFLWIGDATGHGAPAALITSAAKSASSIIENLKVDPATALDLLNRSIFDVSQGKIMMTFFLACYDPRSRVLSYANASHECPYLIRQGENPPTKRDLIPLNDVNNPRLGQSRETRYQQTAVHLQPGDRILFYTDGLMDIQNGRKESWGERQFLKAVLDANKDYPMVSEAVARITESYGRHRKEAPLIDDVTFFMVQVGGSA